MPPRPCPQCANSCDAAHRYCPGCGFPVAELRLAEGDPLIGTTLPGGHVVLERIGAGPMGHVYRAEQQALGRQVAVKVMHPSLLHEAGAVARFHLEGRAAGRIRHPNSITILDLGRSGDTLFIVMEYLRGHDVATLLLERGPPPFGRAVGVMIQVVSAIAEAHHLGVIHRDLKPENIILEPFAGGGDVVKVIDFGLASLDGSPGITSPGVVCGTAGYMPPERLRGERADARTDTYACGVIFFQLLTGKFPFPETDSPGAAEARTAPDPRTIVPEREIPEHLAELVMKALDQDAEGRFQTARELGVALRDAAARI